MIVYDTGHISSETVTRVMAKGFGCKRQYPVPWSRPLKTPAAFYGRDRGTLDIVRVAEQRGDLWIMADNGYIVARNPDDPGTLENRFTGYYKLTRNAFQCDGKGAPDYERLTRVLLRAGMTVARKWKKPTTKGHVLVCPPIVEYERLHWHSHTHWQRYVMKILVRVARDRKIRVRYKPGDPRNREPRALKDDFQNCHALITHDSNIVVEAVMAGIPCFVTGTSPATVFGNVDIWMINEPNYDFDRMEWLATLANNQWTLDEIKEGAANHLLGV